MVSIVSGGVNSNREEIFIEMIKKSALNGEDVLVIVPDQFSFEYDKMLYNALGAKTFNSIRTSGFNRLAEIISDKYGSSAGENANENAKIILMYKAVKRLKNGEVKFYKKSLDKGSFISEMNKLVSQLRESGITPEELQVAAESVEGSVSLKLFDISKIYNYYLEELSNAGMKDSLTAVAESVKLADKNKYFKNVSVYVSSFNDFTYDEQKMLDLCISQGKSFAISLLMDNNSVRTFHNHPFGTVIKTRQQIFDMAKSHNVSVSEIEADKNYFKSEEISYLSRNLFNLSRKSYKGKKGDVKLFSAADIYEETDYICAEICRLVREENYCYSDIAVIVRDINSCSAVFEGIFEKYEIPYFIDSSDKVTASSIVHYFNALFRTVLTKKYKTENILKYIKSPLFSMLNYEISDLEDYCTCWNVDGDMWKSDFTAGDNENGSYLKKINDSRRKIIEPLEKFRCAVQDASAKEMCRALYDLLNEIKISEQTYSVVRRASKSENETQLELARGLKQLWNSVLSAVKSIYDILGDDKISLRQFYELFSLMLSQMSVSNPPQKLDCVRIADAGHSRLNDTKIVFAAEVNDGIFPAAVKSMGLITENEKNLLKNLPEDRRVIFFGGAHRDFMTEKLMSYSAFSMATEKFYALYSQSDLVGGEKRPSVLIKEIKEILGLQEQQVGKIPLEFFCTSYKTAYYKYLEHSKDRTVQSQSVLKSIYSSSEYKKRISDLYSIHEDGDFKLEPETADELFFKDKITKVSPTKLDKYYSCPFSYFCSYGLKLYKVQPMKLDGINRGNLIHKILEKILRNPDKNSDEMFNKAFLNMSDDDIKAYINKEFENFYNKEMGGDFGKNAEFMFLFEKLKDTAFNIISFIKAELNQSKFEPVLMEYEINSDKDGDRLILSLENDKKIVVVGIIDRVDVYTDESGRKFVRIIDYKTGKIDLSLSRLYNGLNLQMFVYLSSLLETKNIVNPEKQLEQAGIVYFRLGNAPKTVEETGDDDTIALNAYKSRLDAFKPIGSVVDEPEIIEAFGKTDNYSYAPYVLENSRVKNKLLINDDKFTALRKFTIDKVRSYGNSLIKGKIAANPIKEACTYCDYAGICGNAFPDNAVDPDLTDYEQMLEQELEKAKEEKENEA